MTKKLATLLLVLCMLVSLTACSLEEITSDVSSQTLQIETSDVQTSIDDASSEITDLDESSSSSKTSATQSAYSNTSSSKATASSKVTVSTSTSKNQTSNNTQSKGNSVTVPEKSETTGNLVWVPTNGGTKYHASSSCSNMKDPIQVSKETAENNGYEPCKRCY